MDSHDRALETIEKFHSHIAKLASESVRDVGRGFVLLEFENVPAPGETGRVTVRQPDYVTGAEMRQSLAGVPHTDDYIALVATMLETYDPLRQAVVIASLAGEAPVAAKIKLDVPTFVDGPIRPQ